MDRRISWKVKWRYPGYVISTLYLYQYQSRERHEINALLNSYTYYYCILTSYLLRVISPMNGLPKPSLTLGILQTINLTKWLDPSLFERDGISSFSLCWNKQNSTVDHGIWMITNNKQKVYEKCINGQHDLVTMVTIRSLRHDTLPTTLLQ